MSTRETIAVDTAVWLESLLFGGASEELVKLAVTGRVRFLTSEALIEQLARSLRTKLGFSDRAVRQVGHFVRSCSDLVPEPDEPDPSANGDKSRALLEAAERGEATLIATTQRAELLRMESHAGIPIVCLG